MRTLFLFITWPNFRRLILSKDAHLSANQFDWLGTVFYFSYLLFQYPQNLALQRFPIGKWMRCVLTPIYWFIHFIHNLKLKYFPLGDHSVLPCSLQVLWCSLRVSVSTRHMRRCYNPRLYDCDFYVLHPSGTNSACGLLV